MSIVVNVSMSSIAPFFPGLPSCRSLRQRPNVHSHRPMHWRPNPMFVLTMWLHNHNSLFIPSKFASDFF